MSINERVRAIRKALHLTQKDFGKKVTLAQTYLSQIEKGDRDVTEKILKIICSEFHVNEQWLRTGEGSMFIETDDTVIDYVVREYHLTELDRAILQIFLQLPQNQREAVKNFSYSLVNAVLSNETLYAEYREQYEKTPVSESDARQPIESQIPNLTPAYLDDIDAEVEDYRKELELEKRTAKASAASQHTKDA